MKKILVTGGSGFIAKNLADQLTGQYTIINQNSKELNLLDPSTVYEFIKKGGFDVVIHAATYDAAARYSVKDPSRVFENNLRMFFALARCAEHFGKMIYFGSGAEFGRENWVPKMNEEYFDKYMPSDQYGMSKYVMTKYAAATGNIYNLRLLS